MKFVMNDRIFTIKFVSQNEMFEESHKINDYNGYYFGKTIYNKQEIWLDNKLSKEQTIKTLIHELMHCYIRMYSVSLENYDEENVCDLVSNSYGHIDNIVTSFINDMVWEKNNIC